MAHPLHDGGMTRLSQRDLDEAVESGLISADQRRGLIDLAARHHPAEGAPIDDEPFELFQGFAEIFISLGLVILMAGVGGLLETLVAKGLAPFSLLLISIVAGHYNARHRRMTLPSITALIGLTISFVWFVAPLADGAAFAGGAAPAQLLFISLATFAMLVATTFLSLVIDRRSFLTAGLVYIGAVLGLYTDAFGDSGFYINVLIIGLLVTGLGTWWRTLRRGVMSGLPDFPGKARFAPYAREDSA